MFLSIEELVDQAKAYPSVAELMIAVEMEMSGRSRSHIIEIMEKNLSVMEQSINEGKEGVTSVTGITRQKRVHSTMNKFVTHLKFDTLRIMLIIRSATIRYPFIYPPISLIKP